MSPGLIAHVRPSSPLVRSCQDPRLEGSGAMETTRKTGAYVAPRLLLRRHDSRPLHAGTRMARQPADSTSAAPLAHLSCGASRPSARPASALLSRLRRAMRRTPGSSSLLTRARKRWCTPRRACALMQRGPPRRLPRRRLRRPPPPLAPVAPRSFCGSPAAFCRRSRGR